MLEIKSFDQAIREMLRLDIHYEKTCSLEDGERYSRERGRFEAISEYCKLNETAKAAFVFFTQENVEAVMLIQNGALLGHPITEGFIEAVISNA